MTEKEKNSNSIFSVIKVAFQPIIEKGFREGSEDLKKSEHLPLVIMLTASLATVVVSFVTIIAYLFREYLHDYVNAVLVWVAFLFSILVLTLALKRSRSKEKKQKKISDSFFFLYFIFNFFLIIVFKAFYDFREILSFSLLITNTFVSFPTAFIRKMNSLGVLSYFAAISVPLIYFDINISYYLPYLLLITLSFLLFAEYVGNKKLNLSVSVLIFALYYFLLQKYASLENKYFFLSFVFLFSYLYLFFDFIVYKASEAKIYTKKIFSKTDYLIILIIQLFIITSVFTFFSNNNTTISLVFLLNSIPFIISNTLFKHKFNEEVNTITISLSIFYILFSVGVFFYADWATFAFITAIVSLLFINFAFVKEKQKPRVLFYFLIFITIVYLFFSGTVGVVSNWGVKLLHSAYYKYVYILIILGGVLYVLIKNKSKVISNEKTLYSLVKAFTAIWASIIYIVTLWHTVDFIWLFAYLPLPFYILLYFGRIHKNIPIEVLAYLGIVIVGFVLVNIAYYEIVENWLVTLYSVGFAYLMYIGILLFVLRYLIRILNSTQDLEQQIKYNQINKTKTYKLDNKNQNKFGLKLIDHILQVWFLFILLLLIKYYTGFWFSFIALVPAFILISWAYIYKQNFSKFLGFIIYAMVAFKILIYSFATQSGVSLFNLLQIGFFIFLIWLTRVNVFYFDRKINLKSNDLKANTALPELRIVDNSMDRIKLFFTMLKNLRFELKELEYSENWKKRRINNLFYVLISIWFSIFMFFIGYYIDFGSQEYHYGFNLSFFSLFILLFIAGWLESKAIEVVAFLNGLVLSLGILSSLIDAEFSFHFSSQPIYGKIVLGQIYLSALILFWFYENFVEYSFNDELMYLIRQIAIAIFPFIIFYLIYRRLGSLIQFSPWIVLSVSIFLSELTKIRMLVYQSIFWLLVASSFVFIYPIPSVTLVGLLVLLPYVYFKEGFSKRISTYPTYGFLPIFTILYSIFAVFRVYLLVGNDFSGGYFLASSFIFALLFFQNHIFPVKRMKTILYYLSNVLIIVGFVFFYKDTNFAYDFISSSYRIVSLVFMPFSLLIMHKLLFDPKAYPGSFFIAELFSVNIYYVITYSLLIYYFTADITHLFITIALFVHGIIILFWSVKPRFNLLSIISLLVFSIAILKLFFIDIQAFSLIAKLSLFMFIGISFLFAAMLFNKKRKKILEETKKIG